MAYLGVTIRQLARSIGVSMDKIRALADTGYLRVSQRHIRPDKTRIHRAKDGSAHWPIIRLKDVAMRRPRTSVDNLRRLCKLYSIPITRDSCLGECLTPHNLHRLLTTQQSIRNPRHVDRISLLLWLCGLDTPNPMKAPLFEVVMEREARRVSKLPEPARTDAALLLLGRYRDAEEIANALHRGDRRERVERISKGEEFKKRMEKTAGIS